MAKKKQRADKSKDARKRLGKELRPTQFTPSGIELSIPTEEEWEAVLKKVCRPISDKDQET